MDYTAWYPSEIGLLEVTGTEQHLKSVRFVEVEIVTTEIGEGGAIQADLPPPVTACLQQLDDYFRGERREFSLPLDPDGTEFQKTVWQHLLTIPYGQTVSYLDIARQMGQEKAVRAVGAANGQNPIVIIVPCHRVIGRNGQLTGYGGGLWRKAWLLNHEKKFTSPQIALF